MSLLAAAVYAFRADSVAFADPEANGIFSPEGEEAQTAPQDSVGLVEPDAGVSPPAEAQEDVGILSHDLEQGVVTLALTNTEGRCSSGYVDCVNGAVRGSPFYPCLQQCAGHCCVIAARA